MRKILVFVFLALLGGSATLALAQVKAQAATNCFPNDPLFCSGSQWALAATGVEQTWTPQSGLSTAATNNSTVKVVVMDSGISPVPELAPNLDTANSRTFFGTGVPNEDPATTGLLTPFPYGHGTLVAGVIGAVGNNGVGIAGINWRASLVSYRVFAPVSTGPGTTTLTMSYLAASQALEALQNLPGQLVVNCNFADSTEDVGDANILARWKAAIVALGDRALIVAGAGNSGDTVPRYPCAFGLLNVVCVGSTNQQGQLSAFSSRGDWVELTAPGEGILSTANNGSFQLVNGTSVASPMVSGIASLLWQSNPTLKSSELKRAILAGASYNPSLVGLVANARQLNYQGSIAALANPVLTSVTPVVLSALVPAWIGPDQSTSIPWGGLVSAYGAGFTDGKECFSAVPVIRLCGVSVLVGLTPLPLTYVGPTQVNFQLLEDYWQMFPGKNIISVVKYNDQGNVVSSAAIQGVIPVAVNPGFLLGPDGKLFLISEDGDGTVLYATGLGFTDPTLPAGVVGDGTEKVLAPVQVLLDGVPIQTVASPSSRWAGVYEIRIPTVPPSAKTLTIRVGDWQKAFVL